MRARSSKRSKTRTRGHGFAAYLGLFVVGFAATAALAPLALTSGASSAAPHIMLVMMENEGYDQVVAGTSTPYITGLAQDYGLATQSYALTHPSLPNYLELYSGSDQGVTQDEPPSSSGVFNVTTIATELAVAGVGMQAYAEDLPSDPSNDSGTYVVHHNPWEYFTDPPSLADATTMVSDLNSTTPPDFVWFTPNEIDDGDSGAPQATVLQDENSFLSSFIPEVQATSWYQDGGQIIVQWDEGLDSDTSGINGGDGGHIATIVVSSALKADPQQDATPVDTAGILHSIETAYGVSLLGDSAQSANGNIDPLITTSAPAAAPPTTPSAAPAPAPAPAKVAAPATAAKPATTTPAAKPAAAAPAAKPAATSSAKTNPTSKPAAAAPAAKPASAATPARIAPSAPGPAVTAPPVLSTVPVTVPTATPVVDASPSSAATAHPLGTGSGTTPAHLDLAASHAGGPNVLLLAGTFVLGLFTVAMAVGLWRRGHRGRHTGAGRDPTPALTV